MITFGIVLVVLQCLGVLGSFIAGKNPFTVGFMEFIGYFLCGIIGIILIVVGCNRKKSNKQENQKKHNKGENIKMNRPLKIEFESWLITRGYKVKTPSGRPSTVPRYVTAIEKIMYWERLYNWEEVAENINLYVRDYDVCGKKSDLGAISHNTVISALKRFKEFLQETSFD